MSQLDSNPNEPSRMKKLLSGGSEADDSPISRLQRSIGVGGSKSKKEDSSAPKQSVPKHSPALPKPKIKPQSNFSEYRFMPAFWTIASVMSFSVNVILVIVLLIVLQNFSVIGITLNDLGSHLLGGLYTNFVKMDQAHIKTIIPVSKEIPVVFNLNVSGATNVTLSQDVVISGALVTVNTGGLNINNARANIVLPEGTVLPIFIQNLVVPVDQKVLAELDVTVDIPLNQTDLHEPFVGLQKVVEPFYCLIQREVLVNGVNVCP